MHSARIDIWFLAKQMLLWLIIPCAVGVAIDLATGLWPVVTIVVIVVVIPLAGVMVSRAALSEMDRVIREVAPEVAPEGERVVAECAEENTTGSKLIEGV